MIKWNDIKQGLPIQDGTYLVLLEGFKLPVLAKYDLFDEFFHINSGAVLDVSHWCPLPDLLGADEKFEDDDGGVLNSKLEYAIYFSLDEVITYRENLRFMLTYSDVPPYLRGKLTKLLQNFENVTGDRK